MAGIINDAYKLGGVPQTASRHVAMATSYDVYCGVLQIGFISSITLGHNRTATQIRHLNSMDAGIAVDTTVTPDAVTLNFAGFYVYAASDTIQLGALGTGPTMGRASGQAFLRTLDQQVIPFDIVVKHAVNGAGVTDAAVKTVIGVYKNCTISTMSIPITIGNAGVSDNGTLTVGYVASAQ